MYTVQNIYTVLFYICRMKAKEFLINNRNRLNLSGIAKIMYGDKTYADSLLSKKLNGTFDRKWTKNDEQKAIAALKQLHIDIEKVIGGQ